MQHKASKLKWSSSHETELYKLQQNVLIILSFKQEMNDQNSTKHCLFNRMNNQTNDAH